MRPISSIAATSPYPLLMVPLLKEKVWGGRRLGHYGKSLPAGTAIGESWEVADLPATAPGGGGGGEARSVIAGGPLAGTTLHEVMTGWGHRLLGDSSPTSGGDFPLLVKLLDAAEHLSVQVHPTPEYVAAHPEAHLKTETWVVLDAEPGAELYLGLRPGLTRDDVSRGVREHRLPDMLRAVPAVPGDCHHVPSGTIHALGAGVLVAEVQTPSDTTFRLYDWAEGSGRAGRELHVEQALESLHLAEITPPVRAPESAAVTLLVETAHYWIEQIRPGLAPYADVTGDAWRVLMATAGTTQITAVDRSFAATELGMGDTAVVPAACLASLRIEGDDQASALMVGAGRRDSTESS